MWVQGQFYLHLGDGGVCCSSHRLLAGYPGHLASDGASSACWGWVGGQGRLWPSAQLLFLLVPVAGQITLSLGPPAEAEACLCPGGKGGASTEGHAKNVSQVVTSGGGSQVSGKCLFVV